MQMIKQNSNDKLFKLEFFEDRFCHYIGKKIRHPSPILNFSEGKVELGYNVGTRTNGTDKAAWPENLLSEIIK